MSSNRQARALESRCNWSQEMGYVLVYVFIVIIFPFYSDGSIFTPNAAGASKPCPFQEEKTRTMTVRA
jgi:hypothetical protein